MARSSPAGRPALTSFVGRRRELTEARRRMAESRLVTLTGPGSVGKTRLALELGERVRKAFRDGVWVVELATVEDGGALAPSVATTLAVTDQSARSARDKLVDHLRDRQLLLVLDNCEHLLAPVARLVADLLGAAPGVRVLATSREPLALRGEHACILPPLTTPDPDRNHPAAGIEQFEAVQLLVDRARGVDAGFTVTPENVDAVVQLCTRLDGIPLAIELAATRLRSLSVTQILDRLDRRFHLLTGGDRVALPRQQTLRALIDWSYELCSEAERQLWARLAAFPGGFDLDAVESVCGFGDLDPDEVVDILNHLVAKSLVLIERTGETVRYRQLMAVREYGGERLARTGDLGRLKRRQRDHYRRRAAVMVDRWCGPGQADALRAMRRDHANLTSVLEWSATTPGEEPAGAELAALLRYHWIAGGHLADGRHWLQQLLTRLPTPGPERGNALWVAAWVALIQGDRDDAIAYLVECGEIADDLGDHRMSAHVAHWSALHHLFCGRTAAAAGLYERAIAVHRGGGDTASVLLALFQLAMAQTYDGRPEQALQSCTDTLELSDRYGERWNRAYSLWMTGLCRWRLGEPEPAARAARAALELQREFRDGICTALTIELLSWIAATTSDVRAAARLAGAATAVWIGLGTTVAAFGPHIHADATRCAERIAPARGAGRDTPDTAGRGGMTIDEAIGLALDTTSPPSRAPARVAGDCPLTRRELEIAGLVAEGLRNRAIAEKLVLSSRTVDGHMERILTKLGFTSRAQVASWVANQAATGRG